MTQQDLLKLLEKYCDNQCSELEKQQVLDWYKSVGYQGLEKELSQFDEIIEKNKIWKLVRQKINSEKKKNLLPLWPYVKWASAAAVFLIFCVAGWLLQQNYGAITFTSTGSHARIAYIINQNQSIEKNNYTKLTIAFKLEDGSIIRLKPGSKIIYPAHFEKSQREIVLKGEAFFEVSKDKARPFLVYTENLTTRVLGTSFNIKAYEDGNDIEVSVKTGKVSVSCDGKIYNNIINKSKVELSPNQEAFYYKKENRLVKRIVENPEMLVSKELHRFAFENARMAEVFEKIEELYGIEIVAETPEIYNCNLTAEFTNQPLMTRMDMICKSIGATYEVEEGRITVRGAGCEQ